MAHAHGTPEVQSAIESSPIPVLDPEYLAGVIEERSQAAELQAWVRLNDVEMLAAAAGALLVAVRSELGEDQNAPMIPAASVA